MTPALPLISLKLWCKCEISVLMHENVDVVKELERRSSESLGTIVRAEIRRYMVQSQPVKGKRSERTFIAAALMSLCFSSSSFASFSATEAELT